MYKRGDIVVIYSPPLAKTEALGEAELIEKLNEKQRTERWLVRFLGEHKLEARTIERLEEEEETKTPKLEKRLSASGHIQYRERKKKPPKMEKYEEDGVIKYRYRKMREEAARSYDRDSFKDYLKQIKKK